METEKTSASSIPRYHGRRGEDNGLWSLRLRAACRVKGVWYLVDNVSLTSTTKTSTGSDMSSAKREIQTAGLEKASGMISSALGDSPLRVVADEDGNPLECWNCLTPGMPPIAPYQELRYRHNSIG